MLKKRIVYLIAVAAVSTAFVGCDMISSALDTVFLDAPDVAASDLSDYDTTTTTVPQGDSDAVDKGFTLAMQALAAQNPMSRLLGDDYEDMVTILRYSSPEMYSLLGDSAASRNLTASAGVVINNETTTYNSIDMTIDKLDVSGNLSMDSLSNLSQVKVDFKALANLGFADIYDYVSYYDLINGYEYYDVTIDDLKLNINSNGNATTSLDTYGSPETISYYLGLDLALGFSLSCDGYSGKYVVNVKYVNSADWSQGDTSITGSESVDVIVTAYSNSGSVLGTKTYTAEQFFSAVADAMP